MKKTIFITVLAALILTVISCKKDSTSNNNNVTPDPRDKYAGQYNVTESSKTGSTVTTDAFVASLTKDPADSTKTLLDYQGSLRTGKPWSDWTFEYKIISADSISMTVQASLGAGGRIFGTDSIKVHYDFFDVPTSKAYRINQTWVKI